MAGLLCCLLAISCSSLETEDTLLGVAGRETVSGESKPGRWLVVVELDGGYIADGTDVAVAFFESDLSCADGREVPGGPAGILVGRRVAAKWNPNSEIDASHPPVVNGLSVTVECA